MLTINLPAIQLHLFLRFVGMVNHVWKDGRGRLKCAQTVGHALKETLAHERSFISFKT